VDNGCDAYILSHKYFTEYEMVKMFVYWNVIHNNGFLYSNTRQWIKLSIFILLINIVKINHVANIITGIV
jgi:hypothetical protein